jgi:aminopeptidase N
MRAVFSHVLIRLASKPPIQLQSGLRDGQQVGLVAVDVCLVLLRTLRTAVLMSALASCASTADPTDPDLHVHTWHQPVPVSAYLIALAVGQLAQRDLSPRVRVWAEPDVVEKAAFEFTQTEEFLTAAESLSCPYKYDPGYPISYLFFKCDLYRWTRYDILCLPASFPYGGMENPCLTFATPTLLAGDRSLADVIAHEIAHSWTGNLVTNHTWEHFWLNEGWTVWLERKIIAKVKGNVDYLKLSAQVNFGKPYTVASLFTYGFAVRLVGKGLWMTRLDCPMDQKLP